jgi:cytochrome c-type biogenesis protein CcmH
LTAFIALALTMLAIACALVLVPLLRSRASNAADGESTNLSVLRDQRRELDADLANGVIGRDHHQMALAELDRRVLEETRERGARVPAASRAPTITAVVIAAAFPVLAIALYLVLGTPAALNPSLLARSAPADASSQQAGAQDIDAMIERVKERLAREPANVEGWTVLARTYYALGRMNEAAGAFERAVGLAPNDAALLADYADALGTTQNQSLEGKPAELIARALAADPTQWKANALAGTLAFARKDYPKAAGYWQRVRDGVPADSPIARQIDESLAEARRLAGGAAPSLPTAPAGAASPPGVAIAGTVSLAPAIAAQAAPDDTVFIFARPADGSRMPLAVVRGKVKDLPIAFRLDDSNAMSPTHRLSSHAEVIVGARLSRSGTATPQPGDIESVVGPIRVGASALSLVLDQRKP